jgi:hypothetical protein
MVALTCDDVRLKSQPRQVIEDAALALGSGALAVVVLDAKTHDSIQRARGSPDIDGIDDVADVQPAGG